MVNHNFHHCKYFIVSLKNGFSLSLVSPAPFSECLCVFCLFIYLSLTPPPPVSFSLFISLSASIPLSLSLSLSLPLSLSLSVPLSLDFYLSLRQTLIQINTSTHLAHIFRLISPKVQH